MDGPVVKAQLPRLPSQALMQVRSWKFTGLKVLILNAIFEQRMCCHHRWALLLPLSASAQCWPSQHWSILLLHMQ